MGPARGRLHVYIEDKIPSEIVSKPHVVGITRDLELKRPGNWAGSWVGALFDYHPPMLGFESERTAFALLRASGRDRRAISRDAGNFAPRCKENVGLHLPPCGRRAPRVDRRSAPIGYSGEWPRKGKAAPPAGLSARTSRGITPRLAKASRKPHQDESRRSLVRLAACGRSPSTRPEGGQAEASPTLQEGPLQASFTCSIVKECAGKLYVSVLPCAEADFCTVLTRVVLKSFSALMSGPFTSVTATAPENCLSARSISAAMACDGWRLVTLSIRVPLSSAAEVSR